MTPSDAVKHFGSQAALARAVRIKPPSVSEWIAAGRIPIVRQYQIELATGGALKADEPANQEAA